MDNLTKNIFSSPHNTHHNQKITDIKNNNFITQSNKKNISNNHTNTNSNRFQNRLKKKSINKLKFRTQIMDTYNRDIFKCECGGSFEYVYTYNPLEGGANDRYYRKNCIDEMRMLWLSRGGPTSRLN